VLIFTAESLKSPSMMIHLLFHFYVLAVRNAIQIFKDEQNTLKAYQIPDELFKDHPSFISTAKTANLQLPSFD
jgi:hypothetical protein